MKRTYSHKRTQRRGRAATDSSEGSSLPESSIRQRKRQKIEVEVVVPGPSPGHGISEDVDSDEKQECTGRSFQVSRATSQVTARRTQLPAHVPSSEVQVTYLSRTPSHSQESYTAPVTPSPKSLTRSDTLPVVSADQVAHSPSPKKPARDLSELFDFSLATNNKASAKRKKPTSIAKRMLGRSRTESSIGSASASSSLENIGALAAPPDLGPVKLAKTRSDEIIDLTAGSASSSRSHSVSPSKSQSLDDISSPIAGARPSLVPTSIRTYAGKSRSFLVALPAAQYGSLSRNNSNSQSVLADEDNVYINSQEDDFEIRESYTDLRTRWGVDDSEDDPRPSSPLHASPGDKSKRKGKGKQPDVHAEPLPNGMLNDLKSITELRSKGESRRFLDEVGYLFEGLDANGAIGVRRASALEIVTKLCDADFARRAKAADFLGRAWEVFREAGAGNGDKVLDTTLIFYAALVAQDSRDLQDIASKSDFASALYRMLAILERENDPLWLISCGLSDAELRKAGISKAEKTSLAILHSVIRKKSGLLEEWDIISNRLLISHALTGLPSSSNISTHLSSLLRSLTTELKPIPSRVSAFTSGLPLFPSPSSSSYMDIPSLVHVDHCLQLLDSYLLGRWTDSGAENSHDTRRLNAQREDGLGEKLMALCVACDVQSRDAQRQEQHHLVYRCLESAFRVLINLTHDDLPWCQAVLDADFALVTIVRLVIMSQRQRGRVLVKREDEQLDAPDDTEETASSLDRLCLALGLLTNLVQVSHEAKDATRNTLLGFACSGKRACMLSCSCVSRVSALECLVLVYLQHCKSEHELDPVVRGHMAVLFGLLMKDNPDNQRVVLQSLPGSSDRKKLKSLVEHAREFTLFYVEFTKKVSAAVSQPQLDDEGGEPDAESGIVSGIDESVERVLRDAHGETVAREVISFLEVLEQEKH
ncbi:predicted protein [Sparassis crispa]|uniref:Wings apart-like protein C-terminal domain-containing protein n=1 Tax=Sparassis crispa TaxID=139825 RepID=A0A401GZU7_9APHY|nr:predicted protein [Sparassis crispa]GBE87659.1 predicted protein [Sparassis crispa]